MRVLGLSCSGHGTSMCLVEDGRIAGALNLERITRRKPSLVSIPGYMNLVEGFFENEAKYKLRYKPYNFFDVFPLMLKYVTGYDNLKEAGIDLIVKCPDNIGPVQAREDDEFNELYNKCYREVLDYFAGTPIYFELEHHMAHAYQAYLCSPFKEAAILTVDGRGENLKRLDFASISTTLCSGMENRVQVFEEICFPSSLGGVYSKFTMHLGFDLDQEGKTMALAAYGTDAFYRRNLDTFKYIDDGRYGFSFNRDRSDLLLFERMYAWCPPRKPGEMLKQCHFELAWAVQRICEDIIINAARGLHKRTGFHCLAMAGGVGLNCVANRKILAETPIRELYVTPNAGDRGLSVGCALYGYHILKAQNDRHPPTHDYLGRFYSNDEIQGLLNSTPGIRFQRCENIAGETAGRIAQGNIVGWFQGGAEFGPRALGHRSILADPRHLQSKKRLDREVKYREWFRPYAPSVLREDCAAYFDLEIESPYMLLAANVRPEYRDQVRGIVHVDNTARIQTVTETSDPLYYRLISTFKRLTGIPMILNTSFNRRGEPIVEAPPHAVDCFLNTKMDYLAIGDFLVWKDNSSPGPGWQNVPGS